MATSYSDGEARSALSPVAALFLLHWYWVLMSLIIDWLIESLVISIGLFTSTVLVFWGINPLESRGNYSATSSNMKLVLWLLMCGLLHLVQRGGDLVGPSPPRPLLAVPNVTAHPSTASVPITVLMCNGPLLCVAVPMKSGLNDIPCLCCVGLQGQIDHAPLVCICLPSCFAPEISFLPSCWA